MRAGSEKSLSSQHSPNTFIVKSLGKCCRCCCAVVVVDTPVPFLLSSLRSLCTCRHRHLPLPNPNPIPNDGDRHGPSAHVVVAMCNTAPFKTLDGIGKGGTRLYEEVMQVKILQVVPVIASYKIIVIFGRKKVK